MTEKQPFSNPDIEIHQRIALWAALCAEHTLPIFEEQNPSDERPRLAIEALRQWVRGDLEMVKCREAAFKAHAAARDANSEAGVAAARAAGQAVAVAHMYNHSSHAADYAAKAAGLNAGTAQFDEAKKTERVWQWEQLDDDIRSIGFPRGL